MTEKDFIEDYKFVVIVCLQRQPYYYRYKNLISALMGYAHLYYKYHKYHTSNISLKEICATGHSQIQAYEVKR